MATPYSNDPWTIDIRADKKDKVIIFDVVKVMASFEFSFLLSNSSFDSSCSIETRVNPVYLLMLGVGLRRFALSLRQLLRRLLLLLIPHQVRRNANIVLCCGFALVSTVCSWEQSWTAQRHLQTSLYRHKLYGALRVPRSACMMCQLRYRIALHLRRRLRW